MTDTFCATTPGSLNRWRRDPVMIRRKIRHFLDLLLPVQCHGCGTWDQVLCPRCAAVWKPEKATWSTIETEMEMPDIPVASVGAYDSVLRRMIVAAKNSQYVEMTAIFMNAGQHLARCVCDAGWNPLRSRDYGRENAVEAWVVPAPSSWKRRLTGWSITSPFAQGFARGLVRYGGYSRVRVVDCVRLTVGACSQSGKVGEQRRRGRRGAMVSKLQVPDGVDVFVADDVVTTGATVREIVRVLGRCHGVVSMARALSPGTTASGLPAPDHFVTNAVPDGNAMIA
ncbi:competence protein ComF [Schaalia sp. ZJ1691]|uniref:ComF family protein n=1 Tax=Schaalia sp. ZJ1691 TaxID=2709404 RepID=UPI00197D1AE7|nr:competence protein ComF [Schaalia sp. ZJ1691]